MQTKNCKEKRIYSDENSDYVIMLKSAFGWVKKDTPIVFKCCNRYYDVINSPESFRVNEILLFSEYSGLTPNKILEITAAEIERKRELLHINSAINN